jgi:hypothetical protein
MNATSPDANSQPGWLTYARAVSFALPAAIAWGFACIFLVPKANELSRTAALDPSGFGWLWPATFFLVHWGRSILLAGALMLVLLEFVAPWWKRRRQLAVGIGVWLANVSVLFGLIMLLIIVLVAAPRLTHLQ